MTALLDVLRDEMAMMDMLVARPKAAQAALVVIVLSVCVVDAIWSWRAGFTVTHLLRPAAEIAVVWGVTTLYLRVRPNSRLTEMLNFIVLWLTFSIAAAILTYLSASLALPFQDRFYDWLDHAMRFDLAGVTRMLSANSVVLAILKADYFSLVVQISLTVLWLAHTRTKGRNAEFLSCAVLSLLLTCLISAAAPATGPSAAENPLLHGAPDYLSEILAMRSGVPVIRPVDGLQGIVCFPSFHVVLALLITWAHRRLPSFWLVASVNGVMLLSVPSVGNHYLADVLGGVPVSVLAILGVRRFARAGRLAGLRSLSETASPVDHALA